jgi:formylglycine-generating enzyme required for sulfatase activity
MVFLCFNGKKKTLMLKFLKKSAVFLIFILLCSISFAQFQEPEMVFVKGGKFMMGSNRGGFDEKPVHAVYLDDYYIGKFEVTQAEWYRILDKDPSKRYFPGCDSCPVERVTWYHVQEFIEKLNLMTGLRYRLPTEAEWEYAAIGGVYSRGYKYSGSNKSDSVAWTDDNSNNTVHPVGKKKPNELGIYDMSGNVYEWCFDWYSPDFYQISESENPYGPLEGTMRVIRGGSWFFDRSGIRVTDREKGNPTFRYGYIGFRLCRSADGR